MAITPGDLIKLCLSETRLVGFGKSKMFEFYVEAIERVQSVDLSLYVLKIKHLCCYWDNVISFPQMMVTHWLLCCTDFVYKILKLHSFVDTVSCEWIVV